MSIAWIFLLALFGSDASVADTSVTWDEVSAVAEQNRSVAVRLRVQWDLSKRDRPAKANYNLHSADLLEQRVDEPGVSETLRNQRRSTVESLRKSFQTFRENEEHIRQDVWTDGKNFQIRKEPVSTKSLLARFPDALATADNLPKEFQQVEVTSYGVETERLFRIWAAQERKGIYSGSVAKQYPGYLLRFPPFCHVDPTWPGTVLTIDLFWSKGADRSEILGETTLDDRKCIVVRRRWLPGKFHPEDKNGAVMIGWIDLERGGIPLRIERRNVPAYYDEAMSLAVASDLGPSSLTKAPFANYIVRAVDVKEIAPGFHYPVAGVEEEMGPVQVPMGGKPAAEFAPHVTREWKATKVDLNPVMTAENFKLQFPSQTAFVNEPTNDVRVTTDANGNIERLVQQARQEAGTSVPYSSLLGRRAFPLCLLAIAAMLGSYMRRAR